MHKVNSGRFSVLDSWRGIAALIVAYGHFKTSGVLSSLPISTSSYRFVDFFFVLSGFVIAYSSSQKIMQGASEVKHFFVRRIARLWPMHIFVLCLFVFYQVILSFANYLGFISNPVAFSEGFEIAYLVQSAFLVQAWGFTSEAVWNKPAWSISTELFAYMVFGFYCYFLKRWFWVAAILLSVICFSYAVVWPDVMRATYSGALVRCLVGFSTGVVVYIIYAKIGRLGVVFPSFLEGISLFLTFFAIAFLPKDMGVFILPIFALTVYVFAIEAGVFSSFLGKVFFVYLGDRSYSIYLIHAFIVAIIYSFAAVLGLLGKLPDGRTGINFPSWVMADVAIFLYLIVVVIVSNWTYKNIEIPGQKFIKTFSKRY